MNTTAPPTPPSKALDSSEEKWLDEFAQKPLEALDRLLLGKVWLGGYESAEIAQALPQFLPMAQHETLDGTLCEWLATQLKKDETPADVSIKAYARALINAFGLLQAIDLPRARSWTTVNVSRLWSWLKSQVVSTSRDPRPSFLRALALSQSNRDILPFWSSLCRQGRREQVQLALFGLRRMPKDDEGTPERGVPRALIRGLLDYMNTYEAPLATLAQLGRAHASNYVNELIDASPTHGYHKVDPDTDMNPFTVTAALRAAGLP